MTGYKTASPVPRKIAMAGFSMVELAVAIAVMAFCLVTLTGLLPVGLGTRRNATDQTRAVLALETMSVCIRAMTRDAQDHCRFLFPAPAPLRFDFCPGGKSFTCLCGFTETGAFREETDSTRDRTLAGAVYMEFNPPATPGETGTAYLTVAWPAAAVRDQDRWTKASGFVETVVYFNLPQRD